MTVAVDTSFLLQLAGGDDECWQAYAAVIGSDQPWKFIATPSVVGTLEFLLQQPDGGLAALARTAWQGLRGAWYIKPIILEESQRKIAWILTYEFMRRTIVRHSQRLEAELLGEASTVANVLLATDDSPLLQCDSRWLALESRLIGMPGLCIATPALLAKAITR